MCVVSVFIVDLKQIKSEIPHYQTSKIEFLARLKAIKYFCKI